jgi:hypothetical protein
MDHARLMQFLRPTKGPFVPFEILTTTGHAYRVTSPEMVIAPADEEIVIVYEPGEGVFMIRRNEIGEFARVIKKRDRRH